MRPRAYGFVSTLSMMQVMSLEPTLEEQQLLAETFHRERSRLPRRERLSESVIGGGFLLATAGIWVLRPPGTFAVIPAAMCLVVFVLASWVRFDTPLGFTVATQLAFVPLLFALPLALVPIVVMVGAALTHVPEVLRGNIRPLRLLRAVPNSWFAIGPVAVFALAHAQPGHAGTLLLIAALSAQFVVDFTTWTLRQWFIRAADLLTQLSEAWAYGVDAALSVIGLLAAEDIHAHPIVALAPLPLLGLLALFARERRQRMEGLLELNNAYHGTALMLGDVVEADDGYTGEHCKMVVDLAMGVGRKLGFSAAQMRDLEFGALLHDVGKIAIPKEIINKPGKLDAQEWEIMKTHTTEGQKMLDQVGGFMSKVGVIVRSHHERWDGGGYPDGLAAEDIPLAARIVTCCDSWNAMRTDRAYRKAMPYEAAVAELVANAGRQFDPLVVEAFLSMVREDEPMAALAGPSAAPAPQPQAESEPAVLAGVS